MYSAIGEPCPCVFSFAKSFYIRKDRDYEPFGFMWKSPKDPCVRIPILSNVLSDKGLFVIEDVPDKIGKAMCEFAEHKTYNWENLRDIWFKYKRESDYGQQ